MDPPSRLPRATAFYLSIRAKGLFSACKVAMFVEGLSGVSPSNLGSSRDVSEY